MSTLVERALLLKRSRFFGMLDLELLLPIADKMGELSLKQGKRVFKTGEEAKRIFFILEGQIELVVDDEVVGELEAGALFGEEGVLSGQTRDYDAVCKTDLSLMVLSGANMVTILSECPAVAINLLQEYATALPRRPFQ